MSAPMSAPLRFGILGCARIVRRALATAIRDSGMAEIRAIASRDGEKAKAWADEYEIPAAYDSYEAVLADSQVDAVYVPMPNELHKPWVIAAAAAGKHVLCEKPMALNSAEGEEMVAACQEAGVVLMDAFMWRHHPRVTHARKLIADGRLGRLQLVNVDFSFVIGLDDWRLDPERGGGALYDLGCYGVNAARLFFDAEPEEILARSRFHETGVDMTLATTMRFSDDRLAQINCSFELPSRCRLELVGTQGILELPGGFQPAESPQLVLTDDEGTETLDFSGHDQYTEQIKIFCQSVAQGKLVAPAENGLANLRVIEAVLAAARRE
jgi:xylose dehydrogenase (NAD/NADP)